MEGTITSSLQILHKKFCQTTALSDMKYLCVIMNKPIKYNLVHNQRVTMKEDVY